MLPIGFGACVSGHDSVAADVNPAGWQGAAEMDYENADTLSFREAALILRYDCGATAGTFIIEACAPSGAKARDSIGLELLPCTASNNLREIRLPYRDSVIFSEQGIYKFSIVPPEGTRGIWSAGIDLKKMN